MDIKVEKVECFHIIMNRQEAEVLKSLVQNAMGEDETKQYSDFRRQLFDVLNINL